MNMQREDILWDTLEFQAQRMLTVEEYGVFLKLKENKHYKTCTEFICNPAKSKLDIYKEIVDLEDLVPPYYLDDAARSNLNLPQYKQYLQYKKELYEEGIPEESIDDILTGFIWDESEEDY